MLESATSAEVSGNSGTESMDSSKHHYELSLQERQARLEEEVTQIKEILNQLLSSLTLKEPNPKPVLTTSRQNQGTMTKAKAASNWVKASKSEDVTIYFRVGHSEGEWFSTSMGGGADRYLRCSLFKEPSPRFVSQCIPFAIGPYIFTVRHQRNIPKTEVLYLDTRSKMDGWKQAPSIAEATISYHFFEANDKIYALGIFGDEDEDEGGGEGEGPSFDLKCLDCHELVKGWQSLLPLPPISNKHPSPFLVDALELQYKSTHDAATGKRNRHASHALFFGIDRRICIDFDTNVVEVSEEDNLGEYFLCCDGVVLGDTIYFVCESNNGRAMLMSYNHRVREWCHTPVIGFENYDNALPVSYRVDYCVTWPPSNLFHLGKGRLCIVWARPRSANTRVHCTKFNVCVRDDGKLHAVNVSYQLYKVKGFFAGLEAVFSSPEMISRFLEREAPTMGASSLLVRSRRRPCSVKTTQPIQFLPPHKKGDNRPYSALASAPPIA